MDGYTLNFDSLISIIGIIISLLAIIAVYQSTNKQINNQNKESNRPFLVVQKVIESTDKSDISEDITGIQVSQIPKANAICQKSFITLNLENIGCGTAFDIRLIEASDPLKSYYHLANIKKEIIIPKGEIINMKLEVTHLEDESITFILIYCDINNNYYSACLDCFFKNCFDSKFLQPFSDAYHFKMKFLNNPDKKLKNAIDIYHESKSFRLYSINSVKRTCNNIENRLLKTYNNFKKKNRPINDCINKLRHQIIINIVIHYHFFDKVVPHMHIYLQEMDGILKMLDEKSINSYSDMAVIFASFIDLKIKLSMYENS